MRRLLAEHGLRPSRSRGQNFVVDPNTVRRIARLAEVGPGDRVLEIGAGMGCLTLALAETGAAVTAVEVDAGLVAVLGEVLAGTDVKLIHADAMRVDWDELLGAGDGPGAPGTRCWRLVANLPYNIATPLIADLLDGVAQIGTMLVMVQREVGQRLVAGPGDDGYGAVSVKVAYWASARMVGRVPATVFLPMPHVESALVEIRRNPAPAVEGDHDRAAIFELVAAGFAGRRKMLRRALAGRVESEDFERAQVRPEARAEELDIAAWARLAACRPR